MEDFSIRDMERLSGVKAHTLRVWEQRYGIIEPARSSGKHRHYSNEDLKKVLRIVHLYNHGYKISQIAKLNPQQLKELITPRTASDQKQVALLQITEAIVDLDEGKLSFELDQLIGRFGLQTAMLEVVFPLLKQIGLLWMTDKLLPGQEHFASNLILRKIVYAIDKLDTPLIISPNLVMLFSPEGEYHELGLLFLNYLIRKKGCRTIYLGINTPVSVVKAYIKKYKPSHLHVYPVSNLQAPELEDWIGQISVLGAFCRIIVSGPLAGLLLNIELPDNVQVLHQESQIKEYIQSL